MSVPVRHADEWMEMAVEAAHSRDLAQFLEHFSWRAAHMLQAEWVGIAVFRGESVDLHSWRAIPETFGASPAWLTEQAKQSRTQGETVRIASSAEGPRKSSRASMTFFPVLASDDEALGTLCVLRKSPGASTKDERLLLALASHAALSIESVRRFSQLERSKRQWVEDIDAISDYIVVHDRSFRIVRTNRSLANYLGIPPVGLVGERMNGLRHIAETGSELPCPFCRNTQQPREEYVAASADHIFLVSTSRLPGATDDDMRTIHVLKDITDRREAERRYRELFDSIQEGLFFASPDGQ
ncbi:MAG TPA: GAF domain-containing protein, partial [Candidatus Dormibacteraeota bacterium]|nr:GAF domain-containing protein [Candidatus Dormibacteraeota bacterium]